MCAVQINLISEQFRLPTKQSISGNFYVERMASYLRWEEGDLLLLNTNLVTNLIRFSLGQIWNLCLLLLPKNVNVKSLKIKQTKNCKNEYDIKNYYCYWKLYKIWKEDKYYRY